MRKSPAIRLRSPPPEAYDAGDGGHRAHQAPPLTDAGAVSGGLPRAAVRPLAQRLIDLVLWGGVAVFPDRLGRSGRVAPAARCCFPTPTTCGNSPPIPAPRPRPDAALCQRDVADGADRALGHSHRRQSSPCRSGWPRRANVSPIWIQQPVRRLLDVLRSVPDLVIAIAFIVAVGVGPLPGVLALAINTGGVLGKLFSRSGEDRRRPGL